MVSNNESDPIDKITKFLENSSKFAEELVLDSLEKVDYLANHFYYEYISKDGTTVFRELDFLASKSIKNNRTTNAFSSDSIVLLGDVKFNKSYGRRIITGKKAFGEEKLIIFSQNIDKLNLLNLMIKIIIY